VHEGDDELTLFWRRVRDSAEVYAVAVDRLAHGEILGEPQQGKGRLYQVKERGLWQEQQMAERLRGGLLRGVHLPPRVKWFSTRVSATEGGTHP